MVADIPSSIPIEKHLRSTNLNLPATDAAISQFFPLLNTAAEDSDVNFMSADRQVAFAPNTGPPLVQQQQQQNTPAGQAAASVEVSSMRLCCLLNRSQHIYSHISAHSDSPIDSILPDGEYWKAVKIGAVGAAASLRAGRKYLLVSPFCSPLTSYCRRQRTLEAASSSGSTLRRSARRNGIRSSRPVTQSSTSATRKRTRSESTSERPAKRHRSAGNQSDTLLESGSAGYSFMEFEKSLLGDDQPTGRCGLYELIRLPAPTLQDIERLKISQQSFLVFISSGIHDQTSTESDNQLLKPLPRCRCELSRIKSVACKEILSSVLVKRAAQFKSKVFPGSSSSDCEEKRVGGKDGLDLWITTGWNFLDLLKKSTIFGASSTASAESSRTSILGRNTKPSKFALKSCDISKDFLISELLTIRSSILHSWRLLNLETREIPADLPEIVSWFYASDTSSTRRSRIVDTDDVHQLGVSSDRRIFTELDRRVELIRGEVSKSRARIRLLSAVENLLRTFRRDYGQTGVNPAVNSVGHSLPSVIADLKAEQWNVRLLDNILNALSRAHSSLMSISNLGENWECASAKGSIWLNLTDWASEHGLYRSSEE